MISLKCTAQEYNIILRIFTLISSARDYFQYVLYEKYNIFRYINLCYNYSKIHQTAAFKFFLGV